MSKTYWEMPNFERKQIPTFVKSVDEDQGVVEHFVAVMGNRDSGGDRITPGAFTKTLLERGLRVKVLDQHGTDSVTRIVGRPLSIREVGKEDLTPEVFEYAPDATGGLLATTQFAVETTRGADVFKLIKGGFAPESSIGYDTIQSEMVEEKDAEGNKITTRLLKELRLWEYSTVIWGMNPATATVSAKEQKPVDVTENTIRIRVRDPDDFQQDSFRTITISEDDGIQAVIGRPEGETTTEIQTYIFDKEKWTTATAQSWVDEHEGKSVNWSQVVESVRTVVDRNYNPKDGPWDYWVESVYDNYTVIRYGGKDGVVYYQVEYSLEDGEITLAPRSEWVEGKYEFIPKSEESPDGILAWEEIHAKMQEYYEALDGDPTDDDVKSAVLHAFASLFPQEEKIGRAISARNAARIGSAIMALIELLESAGIDIPGYGEEEEKVDEEPGGPDMCICPECGYEAAKKRGVPCRTVECPECGTMLIAGGEKKTPPEKIVNEEETFEDLETLIKILEIEFLELAEIE